MTKSDIKWNESELLRAKPGLDGGCVSRDVECEM